MGTYEACYRALSR